MNDVVIDLYFTTEQLRKMLANAEAGGAVQVKVKLKAEIDGEIQDVILR